MAIPVSLSRLTNIEWNAFANCQLLNEVHLPNGLLRIGGNVFYQCGLLRKISLPDGLREIGETAFRESGLKSITMPDSVTTLGSQAFRGCFLITNVVLSAGLENIDNFTFSGCTELRNVGIPTGVTNIGAFAFENCYSFTSIEIPDSIATIGDNTFFNCANISTVTFGANVMSLGFNVLGGCTKLNFVTFEGNAPDIKSIFYNIGNAVVYYSLGTTGWNSSFGGCPSVLWNATISGNATKFNEDKFEFTTIGTPGLVVLVEKSSAANGPWSPIATLTLTNGTANLAETSAATEGSRFYRLRTP